MMVGEARVLSSGNQCRQYPLQALVQYHTSVTDVNGKQKHLPITVIYYYYLIAFL